MEQLPRQFGRYTLLRRLAEGGFGIVYEAAAPDLPGRLALKTLRPEAITTPTAQKRLLHEATVARAIDHPNVVRVLDAGIEGELPFVTMQLIEGWSLAAVLQQLHAANQRLDWRVAINLLLGAIAGIEAIHRAVHPETGEPLGIVHRDLAPKNLMVSTAGELVVIDLGLGKSNLQDWATRTGIMMGTPSYMAPEQIRGERIDARADVYALAVICFELLTMERYIEHGDPVQVAIKALTGPFRTPTSLRADLPFVFNEILARALAIDVDQRLQSTSIFKARLEEAVGNSRASIRDTPIWAALELEARPAIADAEPPPEPPTKAVAPKEGPTVPLPTPRPSSSGIKPAWLIAPLLAAAVLITIALRPPELPLQTTAVTIERDASVVEPTITVTRRPDPILEPPPVVAPPPVIAPVSPPPQAQPPVPAKPTPRAPTPTERVDSIVARASRLKQSRPSFAPELNRIISDATMWREAEADADTDRALKSVEARLGSIAGAP
jgi:eukaryotic-like serine/threonine-protein kinase